MKKTYTVAIVGATGLVGQELMNILHERDFPVGNLIPLASQQSAGQTVEFADKPHKVVALDGFDFTGVDIVLSSAGAAISAAFAEKAGKQGALVIDNTSHFRQDPDVPLIVPEVNPADMAWANRKNIIANPNCSTIQMLLALKPLHDAVGIKRVVVSTYQSVSGAGREAMDELFNQTRKFFMSDELVPHNFTKQIAFNVIPQIDVFMDDGRTKEEWKMDAETKKILDPKIKVSATCVRVPVFVGHALAVHVELNGELSPEAARKLWFKTKGVKVIERDSDLEYITPAEVVGEDDVYISRIRADHTVDNGLCFWCVADNLRKGAALNAVQIAELWAKFNK